MVKNQQFSGLSDGKGEGSVPYDDPDVMEFIDIITQVADHIAQNDVDNTCEVLWEAMKLYSKEV
jgi:hypothetical protein